MSADILQFLKHLATFVLSLNLFFRIYDNITGKGSLVQTARTWGIMYVGLLSLNYMPNFSSSSGFSLLKCKRVGTWTECAGWPIFHETLAEFTTEFGDVLSGFISFSPEIAYILCATYMSLRISKGEFKSDTGVITTIAGAWAIFLFVTNITYFASQSSELILSLSNITDRYLVGRETMNQFFQGLTRHKLALSELSFIKFDFFGSVLRFITWVATIVPSFVGMLVYFIQIFSLYLSGCSTGSGRIFLGLSTILA